MSFWGNLETIGKDIEAGLVLAAPIVGVYEPTIGPILLGVGSIITQVENAGTSGNVTPAAVSSIVQAVTMLHAISSHVALNLPLTPIPTAQSA